MGTELTARQHAETMTQYVAEGISRAKALGNRGPLKLDSNGKLKPDILAAYDRTGFYIFEGAIKQDEIDLLRADMEWLLDRAPSTTAPRSITRSACIWSTVCSSCVLHDPAANRPMGWYQGT